MATNNAINLSQAGIVLYNGTGTFTGEVLTQHSLLAGGAANAITSLGVATNGQLPIGSTGADPVLATLTGGTGITITNGAGSITITAAAVGEAWTVVTTPQTFTKSNSFFSNGAGSLAFTLPATAAVGDTYEVCAMNAAGWNIVQGAGQQIQLGSFATTAGAGGSITSTGIGDWIKLVCNVTNLNWFAAAEQGNFTIV